MLLPKPYEKTLNDLYDAANPVIRFRIDNEILGKPCRIEDYVDVRAADIKYWMNAHERNKIHGKDDACFENAISKLLDYGFTKSHSGFHNAFGYVLDSAYWEHDHFNQIIAYPFLIRAGYTDNKNVHAYYKTRLARITTAIEKYRYSFQDTSEIRNKKYRNEFRFLNDWIMEPLPTIYDVYAYAYYTETDTTDNKKIETIIEYTLNPEFQRIPDKAYVYDRIKNRYYAAGSIYHACLRNERKLLNVLLFSNFKAIKKASAADE